MLPASDRAPRCAVLASETPNETQLQQFNAGFGKSKAGKMEFLVVAAHPGFHTVRQLFYLVRFFDYIERKDVLITLVDIVFQLG